MEVEQIDLSALEIKDENPQTEETSLPIPNHEDAGVIRRSGRRKIRPLEAVKNRRVLTKPKKLDLHKQNTIKEVEAYYLSQKIKLTSPALETIFEEPKQDLVFSNRRLRRSINFADTSYQKPDKSKIKKRSMKAKKIITGGFKKLSKKLGLDLLMRKLKEMDSDDDC